MSNIQENLKELIKKALVSVYKNEEASNDIMVEIPRDPTIADYSTNIAMRLAKELKKNPAVIAEEIVKELKPICKDVDTIEVARPGFINFKMKKTALANTINTIVDAGEIGKHTSELQSPDHLV